MSQQKTTTKYRIFEISHGRICTPKDFYEYEMFYDDFDSRADAEDAISCKKDLYGEFIILPVTEAL